MPISDNIKKLRQIFDVTQDELGEIAGVTGNAVSQWENGRSEPRMGAIERMAACYQISKSHLIEDGGMDQIDPVTKKPKGSPYMPAGAMPVVASSATVPLLTLGRVIPEGSHVLVDPDRQPANGSIAVVETEDYRAVMRRWYKGSTKLMLSADSFEDYEDMIFGMDDGPVRVVGTVVWFQAASEME